jgi:hypothetical protein
MDRKGILEDPLPDHRKYIILRIILSAYAQRKKDTKRRILFCDKGLAE